MKLNSFELTKGPDSRLLMGFKFLKEKSDKTGTGEYVGSEMRLKKGICSVSELYNFAAVETLRHQFRGWGVTEKRRGRVVRQYFTFPV